MREEIVKSFIGKTCFIRAKDREESEWNAEVLGINQLGVVGAYKANGRDFEFFVPVQNLSYIERKVIDSDE